jgi:hypothetical protein
LKTALLAIVLLAAVAPAQDLSLPLGGNYRLGRYMPVRFTAAPGQLRLAADGAVTTLIQSPTGGIAPFLIIQSPPRNAPFSQTLHELQPDEKLIGMATDAPDIGSVLFPGAKIISISLDPVHPTPGPSVAWQSLDALVLDANSPLLQDASAFDLLKGGTIMAIRAAGAAAAYTGPSTRFDHGYYILQPPQGLCAAAGDDSYAPISGFTPSRDADYRRHVVVMAVIFSILLTAASLWNSRRNVLVALGLALITLFVVPIWEGAQSPIIAAEGAVQMNDTFPMADTWLYQWSLKPCQAAIPFPGAAWPMAAADADAQEMTLICGGTGLPIRFGYRLRPGLAAAFVIRAASTPPQTTGLSSPVTSPLRSVLATHYPGFAPMGQVPLDPTTDQGTILWPTLVLARSDAIPKNLNPSSGLDSSNK